MNRREHAVLSLFYDEGLRDVTPSFLAYRMRMRSADATALLDSMVREGILDLHIGVEGDLSYRLPPGEARHLAERRPSQRPSSQPPQAGGRHPRPPQRHPSPPASDGADATPGYGPSSSADFFSGGRNVLDGTDGSVSSFAHRPYGSPVHPGAFVQPDPNPLAAPAQAPPHTQNHPGHLPHWSPQGQIPNHQALSRRPDLLPAQGPRQYPDRIPVLAGALSLLFPGMGQFYNGEFGKGFVLLFSTAFLWVFFLFWIVWIWSVIDAYMVAEARNQLAMQADDPSSPQGFLPAPRHPNSNSNAL